MRSAVVLAGVFFVLIMLAGATNIVWSQNEAPTVSDVSGQTGAGGGVVGGEEVKKIDIDPEKFIALMDFWVWPLAVCLVAGVMITLVRVFGLMWDLNQAKGLKNESLHTMKIDGIQKLVERSPGGSLSGLLETLIQVYRTSGTIEAIGAEIQLFRQAMDDRINSVRHWLVYLSASAGALGLLGTVWGMFKTFYREGGVFNHTEAVYGMGTALVTTGVGITISLLIDMGSTIIQTVGNKSLSISLQKAEEFREATIKDRQSAGGAAS